MTDPARPTPEQLEAEIVSLRQRIAALEADLATQHAVEQTAQRARRYAEHIVSTIHEPLLMLSHDFRVIAANPAFYQLFTVTPQETEGYLLYEAGQPAVEYSRVPAVA